MVRSKNDRLVIEELERSVFCKQTIGLVLLARFPLHHLQSCWANCHKNSTSVRCQKLAYVAISGKQVKQNLETPSGSDVLLKVTRKSIVFTCLKLYLVFFVKLRSNWMDLELTERIKPDRRHEGPHLQEETLF